MGLTKSELVGTYHLLSGRIERSDGSLEYPYGEDAIGYLVYLDNECVSWQVRKGRKAMQSNCSKATSSRRQSACLGGRGCSAPLISW
jgi:hypothetical protein